MRFSFADVEEEDSGTLRIETETEEYSADIYLGNTAEGKPAQLRLPLPDSISAFKTSPQEKKEFLSLLHEKSCRIVTGKRGRNLAPLVPRELEM